MNNDEILIIRYPYTMKQQKAAEIRERVLKQREDGVILLPDFCTVVTKPKDVDIQVEHKEDEPTLWSVVENQCYSPFDPSSKEAYLFCDECGITIYNWDALYKCCPYCGKKHTFNKEVEE